MPENLTPRQRKAVGSLLTTWDTTQAAAAAGVSRDTLYRWLKAEPFKKALQDATQAATERLSAHLVTLGDQAADTLKDALEYDIKAPGVRVTAANVLISKILALRELVDLEARISALEAQLQKKE